MNPLERLMVARVMARTAAQPPIVADPEVQTEVAALLDARSDAPYLLVQRVLMLEAALEHAEHEIARLRDAPRCAEPVPPTVLSSVAPLVRPATAPAPVAADRAASLWRGCSRQMPGVACDSPFADLDDGCHAQAPGTADGTRSAPRTADVDHCGAPIDPADGEYL